MPIRPALIVALAASALFAPSLGAQEKAAAVKPALTVTLVAPVRRDLPIRLTANGSIGAWQEAILGAELNGLRLKEVHAQVGDVVKRGQVLAVFAAETVEADIAQTRAAVAEAEASQADARANAARAQSIADSGALSAQQVAQYRTAALTADARVASARAQLAAQQLRLGFTRVVASDDGVISVRSATVGAVVGQGQELFRLIRRGRLEWRGDVTAAELSRLKPGLTVSVSAAGAGTLIGRLRVISPTVDPATRNAQVFVDMPDAMRQGYRPGMFAKGEFALGSTSALTVPDEAVLFADGFSYVLRAGATDNGQARVARVKVTLGRRSNNEVEVVAGIKAEDRLVAAGVAFLADGDLVKVVK